MIPIAASMQEHGDIRRVTDSSTTREDSFHTDNKVTQKPFDIAQHIPETSAALATAFEMSDPESGKDALESVSCEIRNKRKLPEPGLLEPHWFSNKMRAVSPACSVQSDSMDSTSGKTGTRPATFLFTLCTFLANNPESPYMRWAEDGSYFIIPDKEGLMDTVISVLFNQKSYASFARQCELINYVEGIHRSLFDGLDEIVNIYGWRRLQTSPDGKTTAATHSMWKHDDIYRGCPEENLRNVKRNATDKSRPNKARRSSKNTEDTEDFQAAERASRSLVSTTVAQALAGRVRSVSTSSTGQHYSLTVKAPRPPLPAGSLPMRDLSRNGRSHQPVFHSFTAKIGGTGASVRPTRPLPARSRAPTINLTGAPASMTLQERRMRDARLRSSRSESPKSSRQATFPDDEYTTASGHARHFSDHRHVSSDTGTAASRSSAVASPRNGHTRSNNSLGPFQAVPSPPVARRTAIAQNPVDVYMASTKDEKAIPVIVARDRLDITVWLDSSAQSRFVLAGDLLRNWVLWELLPLDVLLYVQSVDSSRPPRPVGTPAQLRDTNGNSDPAVTVSRERIYLEHPSEPGAIGQCCLVFRTEASEGTPTTASTAVSQPDRTDRSLPLSRQAANRSAALAGTSFIADLPRFASTSVAPAALSPIFPASPRVSGPPPISSEQRGPSRAVSRNGHILQQHSISSAISSSDTELKTPRTADAISSLALMQSLSRKTALGMPPFDEGYAEQEDSKSVRMSLPEELEGVVVAEDARGNRPTVADHSAQTEMDVGSA